MDFFPTPPAIRRAQRDGFFVPLLSGKKWARKLSELQTLQVGVTFLFEEKVTKENIPKPQNSPMVKNSDDSGDSVCGIDMSSQGVVHVDGIANGLPVVSHRTQPTVSETSDLDSIVTGAMSKSTAVRVGQQIRFAISVLIAVVHGTEIAGTNDLNNLSCSVSISTRLLWLLSSSGRK